MAERTIEFIKKHFNIVFAVFAALVLSALLLAFILAFRAGLLPYTADGDAFDTIYAIEETESLSS